MSDLILAECSDEEEFSKYDSYQDVWAPKIEDILSLHEQLKANKVPTLDWKCPGRRKPGEEVKSNEDEENTDNKPEAPDNISMEFENFDEDEQTPMLRRIPGKVTPKGSAKKKTTSLAGILSNMERHRIMEELEVSGSENISPAAPPPPPSTQPTTINPESTNIGTPFSATFPTFSTAPTPSMSTSQVTQSQNTAIAQSSVDPGISSENIILSQPEGNPPEPPPNITPSIDPVTASAPAPMEVSSDPANTS